MTALMNGSSWASATYLRNAATSVGCTICPVVFDQWFLVYVITAAISVSLSCFQAGIAPLFWPFSSTWICLVLSASTTVGEPSSALIGPPPLPVGRWQTAQLAA